MFCVEYLGSSHLPTWKGIFDAEELRTLLSEIHLTLKTMSLEDLN